MSEKMSDTLGRKPSKKTGRNNQASGGLAAKTTAQVTAVENKLVAIEEGLSTALADRVEQVPQNVMRLTNQKVQERMTAMPNIADELLEGFDWKQMGAALGSNFTLPSTSSSSQPAKFAGN